MQEEVLPALSVLTEAARIPKTSTIGNSLYKSSLSKGGNFANNVISSIAQGNYGQVGSIKGADAEKAFVSYMGMNASQETPLSFYSKSGFHAPTPLMYLLFIWS